MTNALTSLARHLHREDGFVIGRVALVVVILAVIVVAALIALVIPN